MKFPSSDYSYGAHDTIDKLSSPPVEFWPVYSYGVRGKATREEFAKNFETMAARGIRGLYMLPYTNAFLPYKLDEHEYLSDDFMDMMRAFVEEAEKKGINLWLYDEAGWPSGSANGFIVRDNPDLVAYALDSKGNKVIPAPMAQPYPDLMNKRSTEKFIEYTHERYKEVFNDFGKHFAMVFTDEPYVGSIDDDTLKFWTDDFTDRFREEFGYDIMDHFDLLFGKEPCDEMGRRVRADYHDLASKLFVKNYFLPLRDFCRANGSLATGHLQGDDAAFASAKWGFHHLLRCLRAMDVPAIDVIWRQIFPGPLMPAAEPFAPLCANTHFPRYASSAAHQIGARLALSESFGVYGVGMTSPERRWVYNFQLVRGINMLNPMSLRHSYKGRQYAATIPIFSEFAPGANDLYGFNLWAARAGYLMSAGKPIAQSALYIPLYDIWAEDDRARAVAEGFEALGTELESRGCDMDIIDDDVILEAAIENGAFVIGDAEYKTIYIHPSSTLSEKVKKRLDDFKRAGGEVVICEGDYKVNPIINSDSKLVRATRRKINGGTVYYLISEAFEKSSARISFPLECADIAYRIDLVNDKTSPICVSELEATFEFGEEYVILFPDKAVTETPCEEKKYENNVDLSDFELRVERTVMTTERGMEESNVNDNVGKISLGDWRDTVGEYFSGDCVYRTRFIRESGMENGALLDLGKVNYTCEVFLNGKSLGTRIFPPFTYELSDLRDDNELEIRVSNTLANAYEAAKFDEWFPDWKSNKLYELNTLFQKDSLPSGLFGPVVLKY